MSEQERRSSPSKKAEVIYQACVDYQKEFALNFIDEALKESYAYIKSLEAKVVEMTSERTKLYSVLKDLHETTCPYKPFATIPHYEEPENVPACTCSNQKKSRYWATQDFLHRAEITHLQSQLAEQSALIDELGFAISYCLGKEVFPQGVCKEDKETDSYTVAKKALDKYDNYKKSV